MKFPYTYFILGWLACLPIGGSAQNAVSDISVTQNKTEVRDSTLYVNFDIDISRADIKSNQGIVLIPAIQSGNTTKTLPAIIINGRNRQISYTRTVGRKNKQASHGEPYAVVKMNKKTEAVIPYSVELPFEAWMENSTLLLGEDICGCGNTIQNRSSLTIAQSIGTPYVFSPSLTYLPSPSASSTRVRDSVASALLFPENKSAILLDYRQNRHNIAQTDSLLSNKYITVTEVNIVGSASPEGPYQFNKQLSKQRALSLASYFKSHFNIPVNLDKTKWVGEDWNSLLKLTEQSDMPYKQQVAGIISKAEVFPEDENNLMSLESGEPYRYMQKYFFPQLRRTSYTIYYERKPFNMTTGRELMFSSPHLLSVNEMLFIADSYPKNSDEYKNAIGIAAQTYPENITANINASSVSLGAGDAVAAEHYLERFKENPASWNNLGVMYMIKGDDEAARQYFQKAIDNGSAEAVRNMKGLNRKKTKS